MSVLPKAAIQPALAPVCIPVTKDNITYDDDYADRTEWLKVMIDTTVTKPDGSALDPLDDTVIQLLFFLIYTKEGHDLLMQNPFNRDDPTVFDPTLIDTGPVKKDLMDFLTARFSDLDPAIIEVAVEAHFAAGAYAAALKTNNDPGAAQAQAAYKQRLTVILGALHDDMMGKDFSKAW